MDILSHIRRMFSIQFRHKWQDILSSDQSGMKLNQVAAAIPVPVLYFYTNVKLL
jgi:hypothetical protein